MLDCRQRTYGWRSLTFFCALFGLPSSSELFTLDLVLAAFFSFCLVSPEMMQPLVLHMYTQLNMDFENFSQCKTRGHDAKWMDTHLSSPYWRWSHSLCFQSAFPSGPPQTEPSLCQDVWCACRPAENRTLADWLWCMSCTFNRVGPCYSIRMICRYIGNIMFHCKILTISYVCMASCTLSSPNSLHLLYDCWICLSMDSFCSEERVRAFAVYSLARESICPLRSDEEQEG